jgi:nucleotide-binding universal stress UspA family protein
MTQKKILVPFGPDGGDLKSVHHALALAERLQAKVVILQWGSVSGGGTTQSSWVAEALAEVIAGARLAGLSLSHLTVAGPPADEIADVIADEGVDLVVLSADQDRLESALLHRQPRLAGTIIRVKEKEAMDLSVKEGGRPWRS